METLTALPVFNIVIFSLLAEAPLAS
jgi:hypothetical protein